MRRLIALVMAGLLMIWGLGMASIVNAADTQACLSGRVELYENTGPSGGDGIAVCYSTAISNLYNLAHTQSGWCNAVVQDAHDDWNDCISKIVITSLSGKHFCAWTNANYTGSRFVKQPGTGYSEFFWPSTFADSISSINWEGQTGC